jgi:hypothetical protein
VTLYTSSFHDIQLTAVKRLQIYIQEDVDHALGVEARRRRMSKAALIREYVADRLHMLGQDPVDAFIGSFGGGADLSASVDDVVYAPRG